MSVQGSLYQQFEFLIRIPIELFVFHHLYDLVDVVYGGWFIFGRLHHRCVCCLCRIVSFFRSFFFQNLTRCNLKNMSSVNFILCAEVIHDVILFLDEIEASFLALVDELLFNFTEFALPLGNILVDFIECITSIEEVVGIRLVEILMRFIRRK